MRLSVLLTCFNRKEKTMECLDHLFAIDTKSLGIGQMDVILVDDGSSDGTKDAVSSVYDEVTILDGDGHLYWGGGMRKAMVYARKLEPDFMVWLNDDTMIYEDALRTMLEDYEKAMSGGIKGAIISGCIVHPVTKEVTYGGFIKNKTPGNGKPKSWRAISDGNIVEMDEMNGNLVLIPKNIIDDIGVLDKVFRHAFGDIDYSGRALKAGYKVYLSRKPVGECEDNVVRAKWKDPSVPLVERFKSINHTRGVPFKANVTFFYRYGGPLWMLKVLSPYLTILRTSIRYKVSGGRRS